ncbi:MAG TPA: type VI secretion system baseplate subunit TssG [Beijerinckiaceae bacterium]|nr:type VI secretion system baseplate subunit TssG [Beijerinckiaceae bacterium]
MSYFSELQEEPWKFDLLDLMRRIERSLAVPVATEAEILRADTNIELALAQPRPRVGDSVSRIDETIRVDGRPVRFSFGQDPWMEFPASNVAALAWRSSRPADIRPEDVAAKFETDAPLLDKLHVVSRFIGLLGAQGALPLATTEEVQGWVWRRDEAFVHFLDIFNNRFIQLYFRAWADARPVVQGDRPDFDRFGAYVKSVIGVGSAAFKDLQAVPPAIALYAGLLAPKARSASRLRSVLRGLFGVEVVIEQFIGSWLQFEKSEVSLIGGQNSALGSDLLMGSASFSVQDKFRIRIFVKDMAQYQRFLPPGPDSHTLVDIVFFYIGDEFDWDVELALPATCVEPTSLGQSGALGWTTWMAPNYPADSHRCDARFQPAESVRRERQKASANGELGQ